MPPNAHRENHDEHDEQRTSVRAYLVFVYGVGLLSVIVVPWMVQLVGIGAALGIGASGITHALAAREAIHRAGELADAGAAVRRNAIVFLFVALLTAENTVVLYRGATPTGAPVVGHAARLAGGLVVGIREIGLLQTLRDALRSIGHELPRP